MADRASPGAAARHVESESTAEASDVPVAPDARDTVLLFREAPPPAPDAPAAILRKEQVRAALFRKLEPVRVGRFVLLEQLGAGAMGEIYAAYDDQLDRKVAFTYDDRND